MKRTFLILTAMLFVTPLVFADIGQGDATAMVENADGTYKHRVLSTGVIQNEAGITLETGSVTTIQGVAVNAAATSIIVDTGTVITVTAPYMVLNATGTAQVIKPFATAPILSTTTHTNGTEVTLICEEGSVVLDDNANQALGSDITLGATDTITLYLKSDVWYRKSSSDN